MLVKKCFSHLILFSFLTSYSQQEELSTADSKVSFKTAAGIITVLVGIPAALYWYQNYFAIDRMSNETLLNHCMRTLQEAQALKHNTLDNNLESIKDLFQNFPYPYTHYYSKIERTINHLIYYKRALFRKFAQGHFSDTGMADIISTQIEKLEKLLKTVEKSSEFQQEKEERKFFGLK